MHDNYNFKPRGIIKWHAFAAVISPEEQKDSTETRVILQNDLLDNSLDNLDYTLSYILANNSLVSIIYIHENQVCNTQGYISKVDTLHKKISIENITISIENILDIIIS